MKTSYRILAWLFTAFLAVGLIVNTILPDKGYSDSEKRELGALPKFTASSALAGDFTREFDTYVSDQFFARDMWVSIKGMSQYLSGMKLLNDVYITRDRYIGNFKISDKERLQNNIDAIKKLASNAHVPVTLLMVPESIAVYEDRLPRFAGPSDQKALAERITRELDGKVRVVFPLDDLKAHKDEYIYFRTDHHWTPRGALYGYNALQEALGRPLTAMPEFRAVADDFKGSMLFKAGITMPNIKLDTLEAPIGYENSDFSIVINDGKKENDGLMFDESHLKGSDKYRFYQGGNQPLMAIASNTGTGSALVLKDSFCNDMMPYFAADYKTMYVADMRFNRMSMAKYAKDMNVNEIILVYSSSTLCNEFSLAWLAN